jgi:hypothetical protein
MRAHGNRASLDHVQPDAATAEDHRDRTWLDLGGVDCGANACHHATADQCRFVEGQLLVDLHHIVGMQRCVFRHHAAAGKSVQRFAGEVACAQRTVR